MPSQVVRDAIVKQPLTTNLHHDGVYPKTFAENAKLNSFFDVLSTNVDANDKPFVSTIEGTSVSFMGGPNDTDAALVVIIFIHRVAQAVIIVASRLDGWLDGCMDDSRPSFLRTHKPV